MSIVELSFNEFLRNCQETIFQAIRPLCVRIMNGNCTRDELQLLKFDLGHFLNNCENEISLMVKELISSYSSNDSIFNGFLDGIMFILRDKRIGLNFGPSWLNFSTELNLPEQIASKVAKIQKFTYIYKELGVRLSIIDEMILNVDQGRANQNVRLLESYNSSLI